MQYSTCWNSSFHREAFWTIGAIRARSRLQRAVPGVSVTGISRFGNPTPPEPPQGQTPQQRPFDPATANRLDFRNSELAFDGQTRLMVL